MPSVFSCVPRVISFFREKHQHLPLKPNLHAWSDGYSAQFRSRLTFSLMKFCETALSVSQHKKQQETPLRERLHKCSSWYFKKCIISWWKCMIWYIHDQYISRICRLCWWENNWSYNSTYVERRNIQRVRGSKDLSKDIKKLFKFTKLSVSNNKKKIPCIEIFKLATDRGPFYKQCYRRDEDPTISCHSEKDFDENHCDLCGEV